MTETKLFLTIDKMLRVNRFHKALIDSRVREIGIHRTQHRILMRLAKCDKLPSQKELADQLDITPAAVTLAIKEIEKEGYIKRTLGKDTRYNEIEITDKGRALVNLTFEMFSEADRTMLSGFSEDELDVYMGFLERIETNIKAQLPNERK